MSPTNAKDRTRKPARATVDEETPKIKILRSAHVHRSRAHLVSWTPPPRATRHEVNADTRTLYLPDRPTP